MPLWPAAKAPEPVAPPEPEPTPKPVLEKVVTKHVFDAGKSELRSRTEMKLDQAKASENARSVAQRALRP
jgi:hypothetical protein